MSKLTGTYYTPNNLASFMVEHVLDVLPSKNLTILEPSCGDGVFIEALNGSISKKAVITAMDIDGNAIKKVHSIKNNRNIKVNAFKCDYLKWCSRNDTKYDLVIGNPPYISKNNLNKEQRNTCREIHVRNGLQDRSINNIWISFLVDGTNRVNNFGVLAFVIPAEFLKVKYAEEVQSFLIDKYKRVEIFSFTSNVFPDIEQDTVVLFLYKENTGLDSGLYFTTIKSSTCLYNKSFKLVRKKPLENKSLKWSAYTLSNKEIHLLLKLKRKFDVIGHYCTTSPGIVTAANDFFIVNKSTVKEFNLHDIAIPAIQKGGYVNGGVVFSNDDLHKLIESDKPAYFLNFGKDNSSSKKYKTYLKIGLEQELDKRHKCSNRNPWFNVPSVWVSDGLFFKRSHKYPKMLYNETNALVTDASYRITMKDDYSIQSLIISFYNSLSLAFAEVLGRYYAGGVLELTPTEFRNIPIAYSKVDENTFTKFAKKFKNIKDIDEILDENDRKTLTKYLNSKEIESLKVIRKKLYSRRSNILKSRF